MHQKRGEDLEELTVYANSLMGGFNTISFVIWSSKGLLSLGLVVFCIKYLIELSVVTNGLKISQMPRCYTFLKFARITDQSWYVLRKFNLLVVALNLFGFSLLG